MGVPHTGFPSGEYLNSLGYVTDGVNVEHAIRNGLDHVMAELEMPGVRNGDQNALPTGEPAAAADLEETLYLVVHTTDGLNLPVLVNRTGNGDVLSEGHTGKCAEKGVEFR